LVTREMVAAMPNGSVIVDVAVDQGGCVETTRPTTHSAPTYYEEGVLHYGVANMPGAVPRTSSLALSNATLRYILRIADMGAAAGKFGSAQRAAPAQPPPRSSRASASRRRHPAQVRAA
jgi:alanine dehydrogenase